MENLSPSERAFLAERVTLVDQREASTLLRQFAQDLAERPDELPPLSEPTRAETVVAVRDYLATSDVILARTGPEHCPAWDNARRPSLLARVEAARALRTDTAVIADNTAGIRALAFVSDWQDRP